MKHTLLRTGLCLLLVGALSGCASIVSKSTYPVTFNTSPAGASIKITNQYGMVLFEGVTPTTLPLEASAGFFEKARYQVTISQEGFKPQTFPVEAKIDGWYFGNLLFGGIIGMLIVDPATGAMWKLPSQYYQFNLSPEDEASTKNLRIMSLDEVPAHLRNKLEPLTEETSQN